MVNILTYSALSFFPIVGLVLLIIGIIFRRRRKVKSQSCVPVRGMLVGNVKHSHSDSTTYHPVVEYMVKGKKYSVEGSVGSGYFSRGLYIRSDCKWCRLFRVMARFIKKRSSYGPPVLN